MLASGRASPYVYNKCFLHRGRMYVCERGCRYNGAALRYSLPGRRNSGTWKCLSVQVIQMETDCNISRCTFHPWQGEDCKHDDQICLPCDAWRSASPGGTQSIIWCGRNCFIRQVRLQSPLDWLAPLHSSFNPSFVHKMCFLSNRV